MSNFISGVNQGLEAPQSLRIEGPKNFKQTIEELQQDLDNPEKKYALLRKIIIEVLYGKDIISADQLKHFNSAFFKGGSSNQAWKKSFANQILQINQGVLQINIKPRPYLLNTLAERAAQTELQELEIVPYELASQTMQKMRYDMEIVTNALLQQLQTMVKSGELKANIVDKVDTWIGMENTPSTQLDLEDLPVTASFTERNNTQWSVTVFINNQGTPAYIAESPEPYRKSTNIITQNTDFNGFKMSFQNGKVLLASGIPTLVESTESISDKKNILLSNATNISAKYQSWVSKNAQESTVDNNSNEREDKFKEYKRNISNLVGENLYSLPDESSKIEFLKGLIDSYNPTISNFKEVLMQQLFALVATSQNLVLGNVLKFAHAYLVPGEKFINLEKIKFEDLKINKNYLIDNLKNIAKLSDDQIEPFIQKLEEIIPPKDEVSAATEPPTEPHNSTENQSAKEQELKNGESITFPAKQNFKIKLLGGIDEVTKEPQYIEFKVENSSDTPKIVYSEGEIKFVDSNNKITIGRGSNNNIAIPDQSNSISRNHCTIELIGGSIRVTDSSTNGTIVATI